MLFETIIEKIQGSGYTMEMLAIVVFSTLVCCVAIICMYGVRRLRASENAALNERYAELLKKYYDAIDDMEMLQRSLDDIKKKKREQIEDLQKQLRLCSMNDAIGPQEWDIERLVLDSQIVMHFHSLASKALRVSATEWNSLKQLLESHFMVFMHCLSSSSLTESEQRVCMLIRLRFVPTEMAALLGVSVQQITNIRGNINKKLFSVR